MKDLIIPPIYCIECHTKIGCDIFRAYVAGCYCGIDTFEYPIMYHGILDGDRCRPNRGNGEQRELKLNGAHCCCHGSLFRFWYSYTYVYSWAEVFIWMHMCVCVYIHISLRFFSSHSLHIFCVGWTLLEFCFFRFLYSPLQDESIAWGKIRTFRASNMRRLLRWVHMYHRCKRSLNSTRVFLPVLVCLL